MSYYLSKGFSVFYSYREFLRGKNVGKFAERGTIHEAVFTYTLYGNFGI